MKILFSFESCRMPIRAVTLINWLISRGHNLSILYEHDICGDDMVYENHIKNVKIINHSNIKKSKISKNLENTLIDNFKRITSVSL